MFKSDILFLEELKNEEIVLFGASSRGKRVLNNLILKGFHKGNISFCDNDQEKHGKIINGVKIINFKKLEERKNIPIIISSSMYVEIQNQLEGLGFTNVHYFHNLLFSDQIFEKYNQKFLRIVNSVEDKCFMANEEKYTLYSSMNAIAHLKGSIAEVGVYKGGSAKILCEIKKEKSLHLYDTFEGLPNPTKKDTVKEGWLSDTSLESVRDYLVDYDNIFFHKGLFPETTKSIISEEFCLVHLDTDLYQSTLDALKFFWPRLVSRGRIIAHDYNAIELSGVKQAFQEFFKNSPENIIEIADTQVMVIK